MTTNRSLWEILVPTIRRIGGKPYTTRYHRVWDAKVRAISGGLTIQPPVKGQWVSSYGKLFVERMIPVRVIATKAEIEQVVDLTMDYYDQLAVLAYRVGEDIILREKA